MSRRPDAAPLRATGIQSDGLHSNLVIELHCRIARKSSVADHCCASRDVLRGFNSDPSTLPREHGVIIEAAGLLFRIKKRDHATTPPPPAVAHDLIPLRNHSRRKLLRRRFTPSAAVPSTKSRIRRRRDRSRRGRSAEEASTPRGPGDQRRHRQLRPSRRRGDTTSKGRKIEEGVPGTEAGWHLGRVVGIPRTEQSIDD